MIVLDRSLMFKVLDHLTRKKNSHIAPPFLESFFFISLKHFPCIFSLLFYFSKSKGQNLNNLEPTLSYNAFIINSQVVALQTWDFKKKPFYIYISMFKFEHLLMPKYLTWGHDLNNIESTQSVDACIKYFVFKL